MYEEKPNGSKEWQLIESLLGKSMDEQRKTRRWGIFFKALTFVYLAVVLVMFSSSKYSSAPVSGKHTAIVDVAGMIAASEMANADNIVTGLRDAFESKNTVAVVLRINSPGGSPVQSGFVFQEILRLRGIYPDKKVYAAITDMGASGAYYIASAAEQIYADQASIVGSIGVISAGFGFPEAMKKVGVERRVFSAGDNKAMLDPFSPVNQGELEKFQVLLGVVHQQFIDSVRQGRGERLKESPDTFSGMFWTGAQALEMGLIDGLGSPGYIAREVIGYEKTVNYTIVQDPLDELLDRIGLMMGKGISTVALSQFSLK